MGAKKNLLKPAIRNIAVKHKIPVKSAHLLIEEYWNHIMDELINTRNELPTPIGIFSTKLEYKHLSGDVIIPRVRFNLYFRIRLNERNLSPTRKAILSKKRLKEDEKREKQALKFTKKEQNKEE